MLKFLINNTTSLNTTGNHTVTTKHYIIYIKKYNITNKKKYNITQLIIYKNKMYI
jgi:hypothetical protein